MSRSYLLGCAALCSSLTFRPPGPTGERINRLLSRPEAPSGVVFEVVEHGEDDLRWALMLVKDYAQRLRARFPDIDLAVVTHGKELFALQRRYRKRHGEIYDQVERLIERDAVPVHACETHAGRYDVTAEDFPGYNEVSPSGPVRVRLYEELGYERVRLERPHN